MDEKSTNATINRLIEACYDGQHGYQTAAHHMPDMKLKKTLGKFALERKYFAEELSQQIDRDTGTPVHHGTFKGALHRGWMELKGKDRAGILRECLRGEEAGLACFRAALTKEIPVELKMLLDEHIAHIEAARGQLEQLAEAEAPAETQP
jgi:uncharacterized protein (TIGR02284 family)